MQTDRHDEASILFFAISERAIWKSYCTVFQHTATPQIMYITQMTPRITRLDVPLTVSFEVRPANQRKMMVVDLDKESDDH